jgi:putative endonuclease
MHYFYVLQSTKKPNWFYKGSTSDLKKRIEEHNHKETLSNKPYLPLRLVYYEAYLSKESAIERERGVKKSGSVWKPLMRRIKRSLSD